MNRLLAIFAMVLVFLAGMAVVLSIPPAHAGVPTPPTRPMPDGCAGEGGCVWVSRSWAEAQFLEFSGRAYDRGYKNGEADAHAVCPSRIQWKHDFGEFLGRL